MSESKMDFSNSRVDHGSNSGYTSGCRCSDCQKGHANYQRIWRDGQDHESEQTAKKYSRVVTTQPPQTRQDWMALDTDTFWFFMALMSVDHKPLTPGDNNKPIRLYLPGDRPTEETDH